MTGSIPENVDRDNWSDTTMVESVVNNSPSGKVAQDGFEADIEDNGNWVHTEKASPRTAGNPTADDPSACDLKSLCRDTVDINMTQNRASISGTKQRDVDVFPNTTNDVDTHTGKDSSSGFLSNPVSAVSTDTVCSVMAEDMDPPDSAVNYVKATTFPRT